MIAPTNEPAPWEQQPPKPPVQAPVAPPAAKPEYVGMTNRQWDQIYGSNVGGNVSDKPGWQWYHTGNLGGSAEFGGADWIQAKSGAFDSYAPAATPQTPSGQASPQNTQQQLQTPVTVGQTAQQGQPTSVAGAFQQALVNRLAPAPVSAQSPEVAPAIAANRAAEQRGFERNRAMTAERAASQGLDQNAFNSQLTGLAQERAGREGQFAGQAVLGLAQQRAQELTAALALGGSMISEQERTALQRELAQLQAAISREGIAQQGSLGRGDLELRQNLGEGQLNLGLLNALLGNQQFGQNLAANVGMFNSNLYQNGVIAGLNNL